MSLRLHNAR